MEIDKQTIKALSSDSRTEILKMLSEKRSIPADISKRLSLNSSTIAEHLQKLEKAGLVKKEKTGHKWIYYEITEKGTSLVKPKIPVQFILVLSIGLIMAFFGIANMFDNYKASWATSTSAISDAALPTVSPLPSAAVAIAPNWISIIAALAGIALIIFASYKILRKRQII